MTPALSPANYQRAYIQCQFRALMNAAVSQADTLCYHLLLPMRQGGHGVRPEPASLGSCQPPTRSRRTAGGDAGWSQSCAVFGLPFDTDTWNSFMLNSYSAKRSDLGFHHFCKFRVTIQIVNSCGESSLLCHSLTLAPRCPGWRFLPAARVNSPPRKRVGTNRLTGLAIFKVTVTLPSPKRAVTVTR